MDETLLSEMELEHILRSLRPSELEAVGAKAWVEQMSMMEELNVQAAIEADKGCDERVRDALCDAGKMPLIVREVLLLEVWRTEIMPRILKLGTPESTIQFYMTFFNEANLANLLETCLFHGPSCESLGDSAVDLADYCVRQLCAVVNSEDGNEATQSADSRGDLSERLRRLTENPESTLEELKRHEKSTQFQIGMKCLSILRYLTDHLEDLPLSVTTRLVVTHDAPVLFVTVLELKPWINEVDGNVVRAYQGTEWKEIRCSSELSSAVHKLEGQVWLAIYNLLSKHQSAHKYEINDYRKGMLLKLLRFLDEGLERQLPFAACLKRWLTELQMGAVLTAKTGVLIEAVAQVRQDIVDSYCGRYDAIAQSQAPLFLTRAGCTAFDDEISSLLQTFDRDAVTRLIRKSSEATDDADSKSCVVCRQPKAKSRCSRCHVDRYCGKECQLKHWPEHRAQCRERTLTAEQERPKITEISSNEL